MRTFRTILMLIPGAVLIAQEQRPAGWSTNYTATLAKSAAEQRPALVWFTASWCGPCKLMARVTLSDPAVQGALTKIAPVAVDIDEHSDLASQYGVEAVPTFVLLASDGAEVRRATGFQPAGEFLPWLTNGIAEAGQIASRHQAALNTLAHIDSLLTSTNADLLRRSAAELFDLCADRNEAIVRPATERLQTLASRHPEVLLDGLSDPRLATRLQVANVLRAKLGGGFDVDPWSDPATRVNAVRTWRARLENQSLSPH